MKKMLITLAALGVAFAAMSSAQAGTHYECHKVRKHQHWAQHCR